MPMKISRDATVGFMFIAAGALLLGGEFQLWGSVSLHQLWPLVLVGIGITAGPLSRNGVLWIGYGVLLLLGTTHLVAFRHTWPLLLVLHGVGLMIRPTTSCQGRRREAVRVD